MMALAFDLFQYGRDGGLGRAKLGTAKPRLPPKRTPLPSLEQALILPLRAYFYYPSGIYYHFST